jgi:hypothetical protein
MRGMKRTPWFIRKIRIGDYGILFLLMILMFPENTNAQPHLKLFNDTVFNMGSNLRLNNFNTKHLTKLNKSSITSNDSNESLNFKPNGFWFGYNNNRYRFYNQPNQPNSYKFHNSWAIDGGLGKYYYEKTDDLKWILAGGGLGWEYRQLFDNLNNARDTIFQRNFKKLYLNVRFDVGAAFQIFFRDILLHGQMGYATNFNEHYLRPGIGVSLGRLQFGFEKYWGINNKAKALEQYGFYFRCILAPDQGGSEYKPKFDWDGRL